MGFDAGQILLDSENGAYYAGQTVFGRIVFDQNKSKTIHGIYVSCKGFCKVHWTTTETRREGDRDVEDTIDHDAYEEYFKRKVYVVGAENGEHHLQSGHHEYNFNCPIPNNCPSSFEGEYGHIRYRVKVVMVTSGIFSMNKEKMAAIRVHAPVDLNQNPFCKEPIECEMITSYCCWCISAGSSEIRVKLPVGGYCPGQVIPMEVSVVNHSSVEIDELKIDIKKEIRYEATSRQGTNYNNEIIASAQKGPIAGGTTPNWTIELPVPLMDVYNLNGCRFIRVDYLLRVKTEVSGCHEGDEETHAIIFGNIPLVGFQDNLPNPLQNQLPSTAMNGQQPTHFTPAAIITQPVPNPINNYPQNTPYPGVPPNQPYPNPAPLYPNQPNPYPAGNPQPLPYPGQNYPQNNTEQNYPGGNYGQQYPGGTPGQQYPGGTPGQQYPGGTPGLQYPGSNPAQQYHGSNPAQQYPGGNPAQQYPGGNVQGYPGINPGQPYPPNPNVTIAGLVQSNNFGFSVPSGHDSSSAPLLQQGVNVPYPLNPGMNSLNTSSGHNADRGTELNTIQPAYNPNV